VEKILNRNVQKRKQKWGPVERLARPRRGLEDGKTVVEKAQELAKIRNLEKGKHPKSFASESNCSLLLKAQCVNINLGHDSLESNKVIDNLKESERLMSDKFLKDNPEINLPSSSEIDELMVQSTTLLPDMQNLSKDNESLAKQSWAQVVSEGTGQNTNQNVCNDRSLLEH
jgi:hypothetical protein